MSDYLCGYIVMRDYLYLFLINVIIYFYCMLKARKNNNNYITYNCIFVCMVLF